MHDQVIIHVDLDAFFCSVESVLGNYQPAPEKLVVISEHPVRGIVAACNYPCRAIGIKSGLPLFKARELAQNTRKKLIIIKAHYEQYYLYNRKFIALIKTFGKSLEVASIDEVYLDITTKWKKKCQSIHEYCELIRDKILRQLGLECKIGVSFTKYLAKLATNYIKKNSDGTNRVKIISHNNHLQFLKNLKVKDIFYVGRQTSPILEALGIQNAFNLVKSNDALIIRKLIGIRYDWLVSHLIGLSQTSIDESRSGSFKSISVSKTFYVLLRNRCELNAKINMLFQHLHHKLIKLQSVTKLVRLQLKYRQAKNKYIIRQKTLSETTNSGKILHSVISELAGERECQPVIGVGITFAKLSDIKQNYMHLNQYPGLQSSTEIYKIINQVNQELKFTLMTTVAALKSKLEVFPEHFIFRRSLIKGNA